MLEICSGSCSIVAFFSVTALGGILGRIQVSSDTKLLRTNIS